MPHKNWSLLSKSKRLRPRKTKRPRAVWKISQQFSLSPHIEELEDRRLLAIVNVDTADDSIIPADGQTSLREAIISTNNSAGADEITFDNALAGSTINLNLGELEITDELTISGLRASQTRIDAGGDSRIFNITATGGNFTFQGLTLTGGNTNAEGERGGAIHSLSSGLLTIAESTISGNSTSHPGGLFVDDSAGGGVFATGNVTLMNSTISGNSTQGYYAYGGGIFSEGDVSLTGSTVSGNSTAGDHAYAGGIFAFNNISLTKSTISGNSTEGSRSYGGGVFAFGTVNSTNSTVSGNSTFGYKAYGGGIFAFDAVTLTNSTISGNSTTGQEAHGGGVSSFEDIDVVSSIVAGNTASGQSTQGPDLFPTTTLTTDHSLIGDNSGTSLNEAQTPDANGNLIGSSAGSGIINPLLGTLASNGGPTETLALLTGSPAIDAGENLNGLTTDQRGTVFLREFSGTPDIGAFETQSLSLFVTTEEDELDESIDINDLSLREAIDTTNANPPADDISFDASLEDRPVILSLGELIITDELTLSGLGANNTTIDAGGASRIFNITVDGGNFSFQGLTLRGGAVAGGGGAIRSASPGLLAITDSVISGNSTTGDSNQGGGFFALGTVNLISSTVVGNSTAGYRAEGGGLYSKENLIVIDSTISGNSTTGDRAEGGGIYADSDITLIDSIVSGNSTQGTRAYGGGISTFNNVALENSTISGNSTTGDFSDGGGIHSGSDIYLYHSTLSGNFTLGTNADGGAVHTNGYIYLTNSTVSGNSTEGESSGGGGLYIESDAKLYNSTVTGNSTLGANSNGGGIYSFGEVYLYSSIVAKNTVLGANGSTGPDISVSSVSAAHSLVGDNDDTPLVEAQSPDVNGNLIGSSAGGGIIDPQLGSLTDNGGPTETHILLQNSPAIDTGDNSFGLTTDQRGTGFPRLFGTAVDIGAVEVQNAPPTDISLSNLSVPENSPNGTVIGLFSVVDPGGSFHTYNMLDDAGGRFIIALNELRVLDGSLLDFEALTNGLPSGLTHDVTVQVTDEGGFNFTKTFTIQVQNIIEFLNIDDQVFAVDEDSPFGTVVGTVQTINLENRPILFQIVTGNTNNSFAINNQSGQITVANSAALDKQTQSQYEISLVIGNVNLGFLPTTITINVFDEENPPTTIEVPSVFLGGDGFVSTRVIRGLGNTLNIQDAVQKVRSESGGFFDIKSEIINFNDPETDIAPQEGLFPSVRLPFPSNTSGDDDNFLVVHRGAINIPQGQGGFWTFGIHSSSAFAFDILDQVFISASGLGYIDPQRPSILAQLDPTSDVGARGVLSLAAGNYDFEFLTYENSGNAFWEIYAAQGVFQDDADTNAWRLLGSTQGLQFVDNRDARLNSVPGRVDDDRPTLFYNKDTGDVFLEAPDDDRYVSARIFITDAPDGTPPPPDLRFTVGEANWLPENNAQVNNVLTVNTPFEQSFLSFDFNDEPRFSIGNTLNPPAPIERFFIGNILPSGDLIEDLTLLRHIRSEFFQEIDISNVIQAVGQGMPSVEEIVGDLILSDQQTVTCFLDNASPSCVHVVTLIETQDAGVSPGPQVIGSQGFVLDFFVFTRLPTTTNRQDINVMYRPENDVIFDISIPDLELNDPPKPNFNFNIGDSIEDFGILDADEAWHYSVVVPAIKGEQRIVYEVSSVIVPRNGDPLPPPDTTIYVGEFAHYVGATSIVDLTLVTSPTPVDVSGEVDTLPENEEWIDEWTPFFIEIWVSTPLTSDIGVVSASLDLSYETDFFTATEIDYGPTIAGNPIQMVNPSEVSLEDLGGTTSQSMIGDDEFSLLARIKFESLPGDNVMFNGFGQYVTAVDSSWFEIVDPIVELLGESPIAAAKGELPETELWPVIFDIDDDGRVFFGDVAFLASVFLENVQTSVNDTVYAAEFDHSGIVDFADVSFLAANFQKEQNDGQSIVYPVNFPEDWRVPEVVSFQFPEPEGESTEIKELKFEIGDSNRDGRFDREDILQINAAGKFNSNEPVTWEEGDWNRDRRFNVVDLLLAQTEGEFTGIPQNEPAVLKDIYIIDDSLLDSADTFDHYHMLKEETFSEELEAAEPALLDSIDLLAIDRRSRRE